MPKRPELSKGEIVVARAVWELQEGTVGTVHEEVCRKEGMDYSTVQTYLRRLEAKGYVSTRRDGRNKVYRPKVQASHVIRGIVADVVQRLFDGETVAMMNHLVRDHSLSRQEIEHLRSLLDELEDSNHAN